MARIFQKNKHAYLRYHSGINFYIPFPPIGILQQEMDKDIMDSIQNIEKLIN